MEQSPITVIIRSQDQRYKDTSIQVDADSTILDLKRKIECNHAGLPKVQRQKLIYKGKFLIDQHKVSSVLEESNVVVHLVYFFNDTETNSSATSAPEPELRHRFPSSNQTENVMPFTYPGYSGQPQAYAEWLQQYQQQYNYYMQFYAGQNHPYFATPQAETSEGAEQTDNSAVNGPELEQENAPRAAVVAEEDAQDWLDVLFALTRFFLMISVIYFYSSTYRFVIAMFILGVIYLYQSGFFQLNRRPVVVQEPNPNVDDDVRNNNSSESGDDVQDESAETNVQPPPSILASVFCFVRSFFSSLIPTGPPAGVN